jgi:hypothetical protein
MRAAFEMIRAEVSTAQMGAILPVKQHGERLVSGIAQ